MPRIELVTAMPATPEQCFNLSLSVDAHQASMSHSGERVVSGVTAGVLGLADSVTWQARHFGIRFTMTVVISQYDAPRRFVDEQVKGPFRRWRHEHRFEQVAAGTLMIDVVDFESPAGLVGRLVDAFILARYLTNLLEQRNAWLTEVLSTPGA